MKGIVVSKTGQRKEKTIPKKFLSNYILKPIFSGLWGFAFFLLMLISLKYLGSVIGPMKNFKMDFEDVLFSLIGFLLIFLIKLLENIKGVEKTSYRIPPPKEENTVTIENDD